MSGPPSLKSLVCEEVFDERSQPSEEEVREYAARIGIDPEKESHLLPLAKEGLLKPLPKNWKPVYDSETERYYYFNFKTKQSSWEHPLDSRFRDLVKKSRSESLSSAGEEDSKTSIKEELKSFEEAAASLGLEADTVSSTKESQMELSSQLVPVLKSALSPLRSFKKEQHESLSINREKVKPPFRKGDVKQIFMPKPLFSQSLKSSPHVGDVSAIKASKTKWDDLSSYLSDDSEQIHHEKVKTVKESASYLTNFDSNFHPYEQSIDSTGSSIIGRFTVDKVKKIDIDSQAKRLDSESADNLYRSSDRFSRSSYVQPEFTLSGGGSVFLKSNQKKTMLIDSEVGLKPSFDNSIEDMDAEPKLKSLETNSMSLMQRNAASSNQSLSSSPSTSTRSILRTPQGERRLWDVDPIHMSVSEKAMWKQQELEEEKKSVRFNLDKELNISFKLSDSSDDDSTSEVDHVDEPEEEIEWNPHTSENFPPEMKNSQKDLGKPQSSSRKDKYSSPLEEWAKVTWFSKKPSAEEVVEGSDKISLSDFDAVAVGQPQFLMGNDNKSDHKNTQNMSALVAENITNADQLSIETNEDNPTAENKSAVIAAQRLTLSGNTDVLDKLVSRNLSFPVSTDLSRSEADLVDSIARKLKSLNSSDIYTPDQTVLKESNAQEQAFRDWNVKKTDNDMYRPPLSRQQSQQQMAQIKHHIQEDTKAEDRDRALREWNVTVGTNDSPSLLKSLSTNLGEKILIDESNVVSSANSSEPQNHPGERSCNESESGTEVSNLHVDRCDSRRNSPDPNTTITDLKIKLGEEVEKVKLDYEIQVKEKKQEYKLKFEKEKQEIVRMYQEKLLKSIEEESKTNDIKFKETISHLEREADTRMKQLKEQLEHKQNCASQQILEQHQQALAAQEVENQAAMFRIREQHNADMKALKEQFQREEEQARREHHDRIVSFREDRDGKRCKEMTDHLRVIEKLRCEKHLVEDKYRTLKEKYIKLKGEMKSHIEKKEKKQKDNQLSDDKGKPSQVIVNEVETCGSNWPHQSDRSSEAELKPKAGSAGSSAASSSLGFQQVQSQHQEHLSSLLDPPLPAPNAAMEAKRNINNYSSTRNASFLGMNFSDGLHGKSFPTEKNGIAPPQSSWCNFAHLSATERNGNIPSTSRDNAWGTFQTKQIDSEHSPLEALRHQLQTLDELEEQFPVSSVTDAYLRYPFTDSGCKQLESAELEFFRHRIHLERDMIRKAKNSLQAQQSEYRSRMHSFKQRQSSASLSSTSSTLYQMAKEEQELADMEAKLRRTRTVLSEKMIHLRHLENSLNRLTAPDTRYETHTRKTNGTPESKYSAKPHFKPQRRWDWKSGSGPGIEDPSDDVSSDSGGSSGFSSTEYTSDGTLVTLLSQSGSSPKLKKAIENTADINQSLHNLNSEISEIWNVLCKQRAAAGLGPPPLLSTKASAWTTTSDQHVSARATSTHMTSSISKVAVDSGSSLIERTNNLRQWLQKAKISATLPHPTPGREENVSF